MEYSSGPRGGGGHAPSCGRHSGVCISGRGFRCVCVSASGSCGDARRRFLGRGRWSGSSLHGCRLPLPGASRVVAGAKGGARVRHGPERDPRRVLVQRRRLRPEFLRSSCPTVGRPGGASSPGRRVHPHRFNAAESGGLGDDRPVRVPGRAHRHHAEEQQCHRPHICAPANERCWWSGDSRSRHRMCAERGGLGESLRGERPQRTASGQWRALRRGQNRTPWVRHRGTNTAHRP